MMRSVFFTFLAAAALVGTMFSDMEKALAADKVSKLSESNVRAFIEKTTSISSGGHHGMSTRQLVSYLKKHLHEDARFKSTMQYNIPGYPKQETSLVLDKKDYIASVEKGAETVSEYDNTIDIVEVKISTDGRKATVHTESYESGVMPIPKENGRTEKVPMEGQSTCSQILMLKKGVIQMYSAICVTEINFLEF